MTHITRNKLLIMIVSLVFVFTLTVVEMNVAAVEQNMVISVADTTAVVGEPVTLDVMISNNPGKLSTMIIGIIYDASVLELDMNSVTNGKVFLNLTKGTNLVWYDANGVDTNDVLVTLAFNVKNNAKSGEYAVSVVVYECNDVKEEDVVVDVIGGSIIIACPHTNTIGTPATPADCDESGYTAGVWCNDCETWVSGHEVIPATGNHVDANGKWESDGDNHYHTCGCGAKFDTAKHTGGTANCVDKAVCEICGTAYGTVDSTKHGETEVRDASEAT